MIKILMSVMMTFAVLQIGCAAPAEPRSSEDLIAFIRAAEHDEIRESWGEEAAECFTWVDYETFVKNGRPREGAARLKTTPQFQTLAKMIDKMPETERKALLERARLSARPTWAMIGRISRDGTTEAGRKAGLLLAAAIVNAMEQALQQR